MFITKWLHGCHTIHKREEEEKYILGCKECFVWKRSTVNAFVAVILEFEVPEFSYVYKMKLHLVAKEFTKISLLIGDCIAEAIISRCSRKQQWLRQ